MLFRSQDSILLGVLGSPGRPVPSCPGLVPSAAPLQPLRRPGGPQTGAQAGEPLHLADPAGGSGRGPRPSQSERGPARPSRPDSAPCRTDRGAARPPNPARTGAAGSLCRRLAYHRGRGARFPGRAPRRGSREAPCCRSLTRTFGPQVSWRSWKAIEATSMGDVEL